MRTLDGVLFPGGWDIDSAEYGEDRRDPTAHVDPALDRTEIALARAAVAGHRPVLGICRGQQLINVALGGSLHQHIEGHDMHAQGRHALAHSIRVDSRSALAGAVSSDSVMVNSLHHQSVARVAPGLRVTARSPDGTIEGLESPDAMVVTVQCHPEELVGGVGWALTLLRQFVDRVRERGVNAERMEGRSLMRRRA